MSLPSFEFHEPTSVTEACALLARHCGEARPSREAPIFS